MHATHSSSSFKTFTTHEPLVNLLCNSLTYSLSDNSVLFQNIYFFLNMKHNVKLRNFWALPLSTQEIWCFPSRVKPYQRRQYFLNGFWQNLLPEFCLKTHNILERLTETTNNLHIFHHHQQQCVQTVSFLKHEDLWWPCHLAALPQLGNIQRNLFRARSKAL